MTRLVLTLVLSAGVFADKRRANKTVLSAVDVQIDPKAEKVIVIDGDGILGHESTVTIVASGPLGVGRPARDGFHLGDTARADGDPDRSVLPKDPIHDVIVVSYRRHHPQDEFSGPPAFGLSR